MEAAIGEFSFKSSPVNFYSKQSKVTMKMEKMVDVAVAFPAEVGKKGEEKKKRDATAAVAVVGAGEGAEVVEPGARKVCTG